MNYDIEMGMAQELDDTGLVTEEIATFLAACIKGRKREEELFGKCENGEPEDCDCKACNPTEEESEIIRNKSLSHSEKIKRLNVLRGRGKLIQMPSRSTQRF